MEQIVEAQRSMRRINDIRRIDFFFLRIGKTRARACLHPHADRQAHKPVYLSHLFCIPHGKIDICGQQNRAFTGKRVEIQRHGRRQRLSLAGIHLGKIPLMKRDGAQHLHVIGKLPKNPAVRLADCRIGFRQKIIKRLSFCQPAPKNICQRGQFFILQAGHPRLPASDALQQLFQFSQFFLLSHESSLMTSRITIE